MRVAMAIDTSTSITSVAVASLEGRLLLALHSGESAPRERSGRDVLSYADAVLTRLGMQRSDIGLVAVGRGPGSFTGVRIGVGCALGVAMGLGAPVIGVSTLEAMLLAAASAVDGPALMPVAIVPAGATQIYLGYFGGKGKERLVERVVSPGRLRGALPRRSKLLFCGEGARQNQDRLRLPGSVVLGRAGPLAPWVAVAAARAMERGEVSDPCRLSAVYLRPSGALTPLMRARKQARGG